MTARKPMYRFTMSMSESLSERLDQMAEELGTTSTGAIRAALATLDTILEERGKGRAVGFAASPDVFEDELKVA